MLKKIQNKKTGLVIAILVLILLIRLIYIFIYHDPVTSDSAQYDALAYNTMTGKGYSLNNSLSVSNVSNYANEAKPSAWRPPGYPIFLISIYSIFGHNYNAVHIIQAIIATITGLLIYIIGKKAWNHEAAISGVLFYAIWPPFVVLPAQLLTETLNNFLVTLSILILILLLEKPESTKLWIMLGIVCSYSALVRPTYLLYALFILPIIIILFYTKISKNKIKFAKLDKKKSIKLIKGAAIFFLIFIAMIGVWTIRNNLEFGKPIMGSTQQGLGLFFGTVPFNTSINGNPNPDNPVFSSIFNTNKSEVEKSDLLTKEAINNIKKEPFKVLLIKIDNIYRIWNMPYISRSIDNDSYETLMDNNWVVRTFLPRGSFMFYLFLYTYIAIHVIIILLFIASLFLEKWWLKKEIIFIYGIILYLNMIMFLTIGIDRYILAIMPFVAIAATDLSIKIYKKLVNNKQI